MPTSWAAVGKMLELGESLQRRCACQMTPSAAGYSNSQ